MPIYQRAIFLKGKLTKTNPIDFILFAYLINLSNGFYALPTMPINMKTQGSLLAFSSSIKELAIDLESTGEEVKTSIFLCEVTHPFTAICTSP